MANVPTNKNYTQELKVKLKENLKFIPQHTLMLG